MPFQFDLDGMWDPTDIVAMGLSADQAYDEFVFDLSPSNFATPATVNVADLIAGPDSMAPSVSPLELVMPSFHASYNDFQDLGLTNLHGFAEQETAPSDANLGTDLSEIESFSGKDDEDDDDDEEESDNVHAPTNPGSPEVAKAAIEQDGLSDDDPDITMTLATVECSRSSMARSEPHQGSQHNSAIRDPKKRRMEKDLAARISSDLGPEHMAGLFKILRCSSGGQEIVDSDDNDDEEMEFDLSWLDETTLVELYQYVEACCMQTMGAILAAGERERKRVMAAAKVEKEVLERKRVYEQRTPELSSNYSSSSPSPSYLTFVNRGSSGNNRRRSTTASTACTTFYEHRSVGEQTEARWMAAQHKSKRKRAIKNSPACMGGGGTGKGRRRQRSFEHVHADGVGENDEIDVVGI